MAKYVTRNYRYGCLTPDVADKIVHIMDKANKYRNKLVEIELQRRKDSRAAALAASPEWAAAVQRCDELVKQCEELREARRKVNQKARKKVKNSTDQLDVLKASLKTERAVEKELRKPAYALAKAECDAISQVARDADKKARGESDLFWGTYLLVEAAAASFRSGAPPKFERFKGEGRIGVQIQHGLSLEQLTGVEDSKRQTIKLVEKPVVQAYNRHGKPLPMSQHPERSRTFWLRIGTVPRKQTPIWAKIPVVWHRDLPAGSRIKWAVLRREILGGKPRWLLLLTIDVPVERADPPNLAKTGDCGVDIGYRVEEDGSQRVACASGSDGVIHWLRLPARMEAGWDKCRDLQSIRDKRFDKAREELVSWLKDRTDLPDWLAEVRKTLGSWKSCQRFSKFVYDWKVHYCPTPEEKPILERLWKWRTKEEHLYKWQSNARDQLLAWRKDIYRCWCAELRARYRVAYIEKMNLKRAIHDTEAPEEEQTVSSDQRVSASLVALSEFRECLKNCGMTVLPVPAKNTTKRCNACGKITKIDAEKQVRYTCEHCGTEWDQDENAARNLRQIGPTIPQEPPKEKRKRFQKKPKPTEDTLPNDASEEDDSPDET